MTLLHAVLLGIVEGITEFLPISSTGHLMLTETLMRIPLTSSVESFNIAIQLGAIGRRDLRQVAAQQRHHVRPPSS